MTKMNIDMATLRATPWDLGPLTKRQIRGKVIEEVKTIDPRTGKEVNPNKVIRTRRETWIGRYYRKGKLTERQANIAMELAEAAEGHRAVDPLAAIIRVDCQSDFDPVADRVDRRRKFSRMWAAVPLYARPVLQHVVLNDQSLRSLAGGRSGHGEARHLERMQRGLEALSRM